jgi:hypothetical protein
MIFLKYKKQEIIVLKCSVLKKTSSKACPQIPSLKCSASSVLPSKKGLIEKNLIPLEPKMMSFHRSILGINFCLLNRYFCL